MSNDLDILGITLSIEEDLSEEEILQTYTPGMFYDDKKGNRQLDENTFAEAFRDINHLRYNNGLFYTRSGKITEELLARDVWASIKGFGIKQDVERITNKLMGAIKLASTVDNLDVNTNIIPFANGDFDIRNWEFHAERYDPTPYRLPISLRLKLQEIPNFRKWLHDLFTDDDIKTIQEYLGYCLLPTTKAQKALFLVGEGGAGKSVMGVILESILGNAMLSTPNSQEFLQDKFKLPELEHKLVLYDDDLDNEALRGTGLYKKLITNNLSITADRKYGQPFKFTPSVKIVSCCNEMLNSIYDNTDGFYRRLLPILIKPKAETFIPDLHFYDKIRGEAEGILQWSLMGLYRLIENDWVLSESDRTKEYLGSKKSIGNHFPDFMESCFVRDVEGDVSVVELMSAYQVWCRQNGVEARKSRAVQTWISDNAEKYGMEKSNKVRRDGNGVRGYKGVKLRVKSSTKITLI